MKIKLSRKFKDYNREESRAEIAISRFGKVPKEVLGESLRVQPMNVCVIRRNHKEAFEGVVDATVNLKFVASDAKMSFKDEMAAIRDDIGRDLGN